LDLFPKELKFALFFSSVFISILNLFNTNFFLIYKKFCYDTLKPFQQWIKLGKGFVSWAIQLPAVDAAVAPPPVDAPSRPAAAAQPAVVPPTAVDAAPASEIESKNIYI